jgi:hypothetical protein
MAMNPYIYNLNKRQEWIPAEPRDHEEDAAKEGLAIKKANGWRLRSKSRQALKTHVVPSKDAA